MVEELRNRARDALLTKAILNEESEAQPEQDLLEMEGMDEATAYAIAGIGACSMEDLAELAVDELMVIDGMDEERAAALIMKAREPWFANTESE